MAVVVRGIRSCLRNNLNIALPRNYVHSGIPNPCQLTDGTNKNEPEYKYELSFNAKEWKYVEKLLPLKLVPKVTKKSEYPSGWRPQTEEAMNHPYYLRRSKNHMLPVYLKIRERGQIKDTIIKNIHGDLWKLHEELHKHLEEILKRPISSFVMEGNCTIYFRGDHVYYCEQFLLEKGF